MKLLWMFAALLCVQSMFAQYHIIGFVYDTDEQPFIGVEVRLKNKDHKQVTRTDDEGRFEFHEIPRGAYTLLVVTGYGLIEKQVQVHTSLEMHLQRPRNIKTDEIVVEAVRADADSPISTTNIDKEDIDRRNVGQDVPHILKWTPSLVATSDAGTGIGYTGMRIRGVDPTRINVTINGVPLNDAESQAVFWVDLPDLMTSAQSVQIQRGVGGSTFGTGAFGASVNINTTKTAVDPYLQIGGGLGSFNTYKGNVQFGTGLLKNHFIVDGRLSTIQSDGFIDRASADLKSYFASAAYIGDKTSLRFTTFGGYEVTYQAWNGVPAQYIDDPGLRTFNTAGIEKLGAPYKDEVDDYTQTHYQLQWNASLLTQIQLHATLHYTHGEGFFEQYKNPDNFSGAFETFLQDAGIADSDAVRRRWLDNDFYGGIFGIHYTDPSDKYRFQLSGAFNNYEGRHFGEVIWSESDFPVGDLGPYYDNDAEKKDNVYFAKLDYNLSQKVQFMVDLQYRKVRYAFLGLNSEGVNVTQEVTHDFFNPKVGLSYLFSDRVSLHYFIGVAHREPNRDDYVDSTPMSRPEPERLTDNELSFRFEGERFNANVTGYYMRYKDQLAITGRINDVGEYTRRNVDKSYRAGVEMQLDYTPVPRLTLSGQATFSANKIDMLDEYIDNWDYWDQDFENTPPEDLEPQQFVRHHESVDLALSPSVITSGQVAYEVLGGEKHQLTAGLMIKYVGDQYIDNSGNSHSILEAYTYTDAQLRYVFHLSQSRRLEANLMVRNIFDAEYSSNAWIYRFRSANYDPRPDDPYAELENGDMYHLSGYFPQAGRNVLLGLSLTL